MNSQSLSSLVAKSYPGLTLHLGGAPEIGLVSATQPRTFDDRMVRHVVAPHSQGLQNREKTNGLPGSSSHQHMSLQAMYALLDADLLVVEIDSCQNRGVPVAHT